MENLPQVHIRPATANDKDFILSLVPRLIAFGPPVWRDGDQMVNLDMKILEDKLTCLPLGSAIFIAQDDSNVPLGFIHMHPGTDFYYQQKHAHISDLVVAPSGEGKGIGVMLMAEAEKWARANDYHLITLSVFAQNARARDMYERLGYGQDIIKYVKQLK